MLTKKVNKMHQREMSKAESGFPEPAQTDGDRRLSSDLLFAGQREIQIDHRGHCYVLRITKQGKLVLNKIKENHHE
jgi:hemin uptake protein HemP